jgi:hypothetical protein
MTMTSMDACMGCMVSCHTLPCVNYASTSKNTNITTALADVMKYRKHPVTG